MSTLKAKIMSVLVLRRVTIIVMALSVLSTIYSVANQRSEHVEDMIVATAVILILGAGLLITTRDRYRVKRQS